MAYRTEAIPMIWSQLESHSLRQAFQVWFFVQMCSSWQDFNWHSTSHGSCAV